VPEMAMIPPAFTPREKPIVGSYLDPEEMFCRWAMAVSLI
jgi:hypothetical protein